MASLPNKDRIMKTHILGFPRIGADRELKRAVEAYWAGRIDRDTLEATGRDLRARHWRLQAEAGLDFVAVGDFAFYDHVLDTTALLGAIPARFSPPAGEVDLDTLFRMARGRAPCGCDAVAQEMTKWFDTNYHYLVPELSPDQAFALRSERLFREVAEARALGHAVKPVLLGPLTWLWLGKCQGEAFDRLALLPRLLPVYAEILDRLAAQGVEWVQVDEPILGLDLPPAWQAAFEFTWNRLQRRDLRILLATYFAPLEDNLWTALHLPVAGLHVDVLRGGEEWRRVVDQLPDYKILSLGVVDGRNVWRAPLRERLALLQEAQARLGDRLWIGSSCSLLHVPVDLAREEALPAEVRDRLAFAVQKLAEVVALGRVLRDPADVRAVLALAESDRAAAAAQRAPGRHDAGVRTALAALTPAHARRSRPWPERAALQAGALQLPPLPTTTIGSFPQTPLIRQARAAWRAGEIDAAVYEAAMREEIAHAIREQEALGLDVLVHGEAERNDMVEYFGEQLAGFAFTRHGWVQSYGSRCVKPPLIVGDVSRPRPMTVEWTRFAQSLTNRPVKGMLTGPVTLLCWSFVREDLSRAEVAAQLALAIRAEARDLEHAGIRIIQVDEPAFREGLPLRRREQPLYWAWATHAFRLATGAVEDATQIHTHMCYAEFNDCIAAIADMDADVITIETARSAMELLQAFGECHYPNAIGPGVYDIHSPRVPDVESMVRLMQEAQRHLPLERLWVNPDCGLKTRGWPETRAALANMVEAARRLRATSAQAA
jgi:5-methyltetrahydropteroyltriglutamate--homocysteine methyltransferase